MAEKLPVIIDGLGYDHLADVVQQLLQNLRLTVIAAGVFEIGPFLFLQGQPKELGKLDKKCNE